MGLVDRAIELTLTPAEITMLVEALDAYEYWQLGDILPRNNGAVFIPGDMLTANDRFWDDRTISQAEAHAIEHVRNAVVSPNSWEPQAAWRPSIGNPHPPGVS